MIIVLLGYLGLRGSRCGVPGTPQTASIVQGGKEKMESVIQNELKLELEPISRCEMIPGLGFCSAHGLENVTSIRRNKPIFSHLENHGVFQSKALTSENRSGTGWIETSLTTVLSWNISRTLFRNAPIHL
jgi:hypothetical protein